MVTQLGSVYAIYDKVKLKFLFGETGRDGNKRLAEHKSEFKRGEAKNKTFQKEYIKYGDSRFVFEVIIETSEHKLCELVLIELFSRVGKSYNKRRGDEIQEVVRGELIIPLLVFREIEAYLHRSHSISPNYGELLKELDDMKIRFESKSEKIYNRDFKNSFLSDYSHNHETLRVTRELFKHTYKFEDELGKDLYNFTFQEVEEVLTSLGAGSIDSLRNLKSKFSRYMDFSIEKDVTSIGVNHYKIVSRRDDLAKYLDKGKELTSVFDRDEIMEMGMYSDNFQDGVILGLLFDGVSYKNEFEELINLTIQDIDLMKKEIKLMNRTIPMSSETSVLLKGALDQKVRYTSITGEVSRNYTIADGQNVIRGVRGKNVVNPQVIRQRILRIAGINGYDNLNANNISNSGQLHYAIKLINEQEFSMDNTLPLVLHKFGIQDNLSARHTLKTRIQKHLQRMACN